MKKHLTVVLIALSYPVWANARLPGNWQDAAVTGAESDRTCLVENGFSPEGSATQLVDKAIDSARRSIRLAGYSFNSRDIVRRLIAAKGRGVDVKVVVDARNNLVEDRTGRARAALQQLVNAGIPTRTISVYSLTHDKAVVIDGESVQTGSFNYTEAARHNSENALVVWRCRGTAESYLNHWQSRWDQGTDFRLTD